MLRLNDYSRPKLPFDALLVGVVLAISLWGVLAIHSALRGDPNGAKLIAKQATGIVVGLAAMAEDARPSNDTTNCPEQRRNAADG